MKVLVLNGPNLATLGRREPEIYGTQTLADLETLLVERAHELEFELTCLQSNHEGQLIDWIEKEGAASDAIIINPGALSHYSLALADALRGSGKPVVEVHISNVFKREPERHRQSFVLPLAILCWNPLMRENPRLPIPMISSKISISRPPRGFSCPRPSCKMPTVLVKPNSCARRATCSASSGFFTPLPSTELMFT